MLVSRSDIKNIPTGKLYWYGLFGGAHLYFIPNDATFQQMKSSGALRYLEKNVAQYDQICRNAQSHEQLDLGIFTETRKSRGSIFEFKYNDAANNIYQANKTFFQWKRIDSFMQSNPPLLSTDKILFYQYVELVRTRNLHIRSADGDSLLNKATALISELKKEYHLENE